MLNMEYGTWNMEFFHKKKGKKHILFWTLAASINSIDQEYSIHSICALILWNLTLWLPLKWD